MRHRQRIVSDWSVGIQRVSLPPGILVTPEATANGFHFFLDFRVVDLLVLDDLDRT